MFEEASTKKKNSQRDLEVIAMAQVLSTGDACKTAQYLRVYTQAMLHFTLSSQERENMGFGSLRN